jgi:predicted nucleotidyltransferase component of viral defense system
MLEILQKQIKSVRTKEEKINRLREFLQILILKIIYDLGFFKNLSFVGGTALRVLYDLRRFSEDLDFSLTKKENYNFDAFTQSLGRQLKNYALEVEIKPQDRNIVQSLDIKFRNLLFELGLSNLKEEKLFVRLEIDTNPPRGANIEISLVNKSYVFTVAHYDLPSLYATKLHACFFRKYVKGRDFYDLVWYLGKKIKPNFDLLNNAIQQTHSQEDLIGEDNFYQFLREELSRIDFGLVRRDVERFLEDKQELKFLNKDVILQLVKG